jgi:hypothetical protein
VETIRVISRDKKVEVFIQSRKEDSPVESIHSVSLSIIYEFIESWQNWLKQIDALSYALPEKNHNYKDRFTEFSISLQSILFGKYPVKFSKVVVWILDSELMSLPIEILKLEDEQRFYRNIRSSHIPPNGKKGDDYLYIENQYSAESLLTEMGLEREEILEFWESKSLSYKELRGISCTRARFIEKISSVKVLHYSGHSFEDGLWFSEDSKLEISDLSSLNLSNLKLVSLNSCSSAIGLARGFLEAGARECVGFLGPVRNDISRQSGKIFWENYSSTNSASLAVETVRQKLQHIHGEGFPAAFQFVHFGVPVKDKSFSKKKRILLFSFFATFLLAIVFFLLKSSYFLSEPNPSRIEKEDSKKTTIDLIPNKSEIQEKPLSLKKSQSKVISNRERIISSSNKKEMMIVPKETEKKIDKSTMKKEKETNIVQNYSFIDSSEARLEKYISALSSDKLKVSIHRYLQKKDPLVSMERKREKMEKILESTESEELIEYKLRELE